MSDLLIRLPPQSDAATLQLAAFVRRRQKQDPHAVSAAFERPVIVQQNNAHRLRLTLAAQSLTIETSQDGPVDLHTHWTPFAYSPPRFSWPVRTRLSPYGKKLRRCFSETLTPWPIAARTFRDQATCFSAQSFQLACTSHDGETLIWGYGPSVINMRGHSERLTLFFNGYTQLFRDMVTGQLNCQGSMQNIAELADEGLRQWIAWPC